MINDALHLTTPISGFNGGVVVNPDYSFVSGHLLTADTAKQVIEKIRAHGLDAWLYTDSDWFIADANAPHVAREQWTVKFAPVVTDDFDAHLEHVVKIVGVSDEIRLHDDPQPLLAYRFNATREHQPQGDRAPGRDVSNGHRFGTFD